MRTLTAVFLLTGLIGLIGCSSSPDDPKHDASPTPQNPQAPVILSFGTDATALTEGETVTFSAVVTDPDGDLIGGTLEGSGQIIFSEFGLTSGQTYSAELSWNAINLAQSIDFGPAGESRQLTARFFDRAGHTVARTTDLSLHCDGAGATKGICEFLVDGDYTVIDVDIDSNSCNIDIDEITTEPMDVAVEGAEVTVLDEWRMIHTAGTLKGQDEWTHDWNPIFDCIEDYEQTYEGKVHESNRFELTFEQTRTFVGGNLCSLLNVNEGITLPCTSKFRMMLQQQ